MTIGLIGQKRGMTRIYSEDGSATPVTVVEVPSNRVSQIRTEERDGYQAVQVTAGHRRASRVTKPESGHFAKAGVEAGSVVHEYRAPAGELQEGSTLDVGLFEDGQTVDVTGVSKGKGYAGTVKRWNFRSQRSTHGNNLAHRVPGSIGQNQSPGKVFKGKKMAGHMGAEQVTVQNLEVVRVDADKSLLLIKGAVPGATGADVVVRPAVKAKA